MGRLTAGTAIMEISPGEGIELAGYPHFLRRSTGVHDPLYASCMMLDDGDTRLAIVAMDLLFFSKRHVREIRERLDASGVIPGKNVMFCCSHTHSGPWAAGRLDLEALERGLGQDERYVSGLNDTLYSVVVKACGEVFDAKIGVGAGFCGRERGVGGNRRDPEGPADPSVNVLAVRDASGAWRACLVGYALHPTLLHGESTAVSADYPGYVRAHLNRAFPGMNVLFAQGTSGNQSTRYFRSGQSFGEACRIGTAIGEEALNVLNGLEPAADTKLSVRSAEMEPELRRYPDRSEAEKKVIESREALERLKAGNAPYIDVRNAELRLLGAEDILGYVLMDERGAKPELLRDELPLELQAFRIGNACILGLQGEAFVEYGLEIKRRSPFAQTIVFELANGAAPGYIYTRESLADGGYETDTSMLGPDTGDRLVETSIGLLADLEKGTD